ncbi:hypothetical protein BRD56_03865, partial [Thermoplasmatales archaeon SW_10_69_26]
CDLVLVQAGRARDEFEDRLAGVVSEEAPLDRVQLVVIGGFIVIRLWAAGPRARATARLRLEERRGPTPTARTHPANAQLPTPPGR